jgi:hypothetical protein
LPSGLEKKKVVPFGMGINLNVYAENQIVKETIEAIDR